MIGVICDSYVVLRIFLLLICRFCGISLTVFQIGHNSILLMMMVVVTSIFTFVLYYIRGDVSSENFKTLKLLFLRLIIFMLCSFGLFMFIGWEGIGVISMMLIRY